MKFTDLLVNYLKMKATDPLKASAVGIQFTLKGRLEPADTSNHLTLALHLACNNLISIGGIAFDLVLPPATVNPNLSFPNGQGFNVEEYDATTQTYSIAMSLIKEQMNCDAGGAVYFEIEMEPLQAREAADGSLVIDSNTGQTYFEIDKGKIQKEAGGIIHFEIDVDTIQTKNMEIKNIEIVDLFGNKQSINL